MNRIKAIDFLKKKIKNQNIIKHLLATEALMIEVYEFLKTRGDSDLGVKEDWAMTGLLHDGDYSEDVPEEKQGVEIAKWLGEEGIPVSKEAAHSMAAHNTKTGVIPESKMDWTIFCGDSLAGLIVAAALVQPDRKLSSLKLESVIKKFKSKSFAGGTRRNDIALCEEKLKIPLNEFIELSLNAMKRISSSLEL